MHFDSIQIPLSWRLRRNLRTLGTGMATVLAWLSLTAISTPLHAATVTVSNCNDSGVDSLRAAVASADSGDIIDMSGLACTVALSSAIVVGQDALTIRGKPETDISELPVTTLSAGGLSNVIVYYGTDGLTLEWLHVTEGKSLAGGCIYAYNSDVILSDSAVTGCEANQPTTHDAQGGGVFAPVVKLTRSKVSNNIAVSAAGNAMGGGIYASGDVFLGEGSEVSYNEVTSGLDDKKALGGGIFASGTVRGGWAGSKVMYNNAWGDWGQGGGIYAVDMLIDGYNIPGEALEVSHNFAGLSGGGIHTPPGGNTVLGGATIMANGAQMGGGILSESELKLMRVEISGNNATFMGGGVVASQRAVIADSSINNNIGGQMVGGLVTYRDTIIHGSTIAGNRAVQMGGAALGAGLFIAGQTITIEQSTISNNLASDDSAMGAGLRVSHPASIYNSTIVNNIAWNAIGSTHGAGLNLTRATTQVEMIGTIVSGNRTLQTGTESCNMDACDDDVGTDPASDPVPPISGSANLVGHSSVTLPTDTLQSFDPNLGPLADNGGLTLTHLPNDESPVIDAGTDNGFTTDQRGDGFPRVIGVRADIGAVEWGGGTPPGDEIFADGFED